MVREQGRACSRAGNETGLVPLPMQITFRKKNNNNRDNPGMPDVKEEEGSTPGVTLLG